MGGSTLERAEAVVKAAEPEPEVFGDLPEQMDTTGNVAGAYKEMFRRQAAPWN
jgi:hypothetical protein